MLRLISFHMHITELEVRMQLSVTQYCI